VTDETHDAVPTVPEPRNELSPADPAAEQAAVKVSSAKTIKFNDYDPRPHRELVRFALAITFCTCLAFTLVASFCGTFNNWVNVKDWLQIMLPAQTALFGAAIGFYFGNS
jgi:hypothetical protein